MEYIAMTAAVVVFGSAAGAKLRSRQRLLEFAESLKGYGARSKALRWILAVGVAMGEAVVVVALLVPETRPAALVTGAVLLGAFAIVILLFREPARACRCFGGLDRSRNHRMNAAANLALGAVCVAGVVDPVPTTSPGGIAACVALGVLVGTGFVVGPSVTDTLARPGARA